MEWGSRCKQMSTKGITDSASSVQSSFWKAVSEPGPSAELYELSPDMQYLGRALSSAVDSSVVLFFCYQKGNFSSKVVLKDRNKSEFFLWRSVVVTKFVMEWNEK